MAYLVGRGSFLPSALLIYEGHVDPYKFVVDANTGATIILYAAHYGNLKFFRWLYNFDKS